MWQVRIKICKIRFWKAVKYYFLQVCNNIFYKISVSSFSFKMHIQNLYSNYNFQTINVKNSILSPKSALLPLKWSKCAFVR